MTVRLTIEARDPAHARAILEAIERVDATPRQDELLVTRDGPTPVGHKRRRRESPRAPYDFSPTP